MISRQNDGRAWGEEEARFVCVRARGMSEAKTGTAACERFFSWGGLCAPVDV